MPAMADVANTIQILLQSNDGGDSNIQNSLYFTYSGSASATDLNTLLGVVASAWSATIAPQQPTNTHLTGITITDLNSKSGAKVGETLSIAGTNPNAGMSSGVAVCISGKEPYRYRGGHRRIYLAGATEQDLSDKNTWTTAFQSAIASAWTSFVAEIISAAPATMGALKDVIVHRFGPSSNAPVKMEGYTVKVKSVPLTTPVTRPITSYVCNPQVASQRRRNQQGG